jgi:hypothetical protein
MNVQPAQNKYYKNNQLSEINSSANVTLAEGFIPLSF